MKKKHFTIIGLVVLMFGTLLLSGCYRYGYSPYGYNRSYGYNQYDDSRYYNDGRYDNDYNYGYYPVAVNQCPRCASTQVIPIIYGTPTEGQVEQAQNGSIVLGGMNYGPGAPYWHCKSCGLQY